MGFGVVEVGKDNLRGFQRFKMRKPAKGMAMIAVFQESNYFDVCLKREFTQTIAR